MTVEDLINELENFGDYLNVQIYVPGSGYRDIERVTTTQTDAGVDVVLEPTGVNYDG